MSDLLKVQTLSGYAIEVLGQLFVNGPTWDGAIVCKRSRDELVKVGMAVRRDGWAWLTEDGVTAAIEWDLTRKTGGDHQLHERWRAKQNRR